MVPPVMAPWLSHLIHVLLSFVVMGSLILVHELGHFLVARWVGVRVLRFSIGFGPQVWTWRGRETEYTLSAIPLGGYVKMAGEHSEEQTHQPTDYLSQPLRTRALIIFAGPAVNYLVACLTLWAVFRIGYPELKPIVGHVLDRMPAQTAGIHEEDRITAINGQPIRTWDEMTKVIYAAPNQPMTIEVERHQTPLTLHLTTTSQLSTDPFGHARTIGLIGIAPSGEFQATPVGPIDAARLTLTKHREWLGQTLGSLWSLVTRKISMRESLTGPIGIVYLTSEAVRLGLVPLLHLTSLFSFSLALFNLFPIPVLDGGHLFFLLLERLRGMPVNFRLQERVTQVSMALLIALAIVICVNDVHRFDLVKKVIELVHP